MNYSNNKAKMRSYETFQSTISSLCSITNVTLHKIENHSKKVITKNGCTEKGIDKLKTLEMFLSFKDLSNALRPVYERTLEFRNDVIRSFEENK